MAPIKGQKLKCLTLHQKAEIIEKLKCGVSATFLARSYGVAKSTITGIRIKQAAILRSVTNTFSGPGKQKRMRKSEIPKTEQELYKWFLEQREKGAPLSGPIIKSKALDLFKKFEGTEKTIKNFNASDGWLHKFKKRYGLRLLTISGETLSAEPELVDPFKVKLKHILAEKNLRLNQVYNADESALYWKMIPRKTFVSRFEKNAKGMKIQKERLTILLCANATGDHKLKPLVIGKSEKPRCFRNYNPPVVYANSKTAWMTSFIFKAWFYKNFVPEVKQYLKDNNLEEKALLFVDNAACHEIHKSHDGLIEILFLPPNVTSLIQPLDQNIIRLTKLHYKKSLLAKIVAEKGSIQTILKKITLRDAVTFLVNSWKEISIETISKCWKPVLGETDENDFDSDDDIPLSTLQSRMNQNVELMQQITNLLGEVDDENQYSFEDVEQWITDRGEDLTNGFSGYDDENEQDSETTDVLESPVSDLQAVSLFNSAIQWAKSKNISYSEIAVLQRLREKAVIASITKAKQMNITDYFK